MNKIIVIVGPTGVGKTKLSILLAHKYNGEIINADSMQIYKGLNIGTAKVTEQEKEGIIHHLLDIKDVTEEYSIYNYQTDCRNTINKIINKGKTPIIVGGTGLYIKSTLYDYKLIENIEENNYSKLTNQELYEKLINIDPKSKDKININNRKRVINALNYYLNTHTSITDNKTDKLLYDCLFIGLTTDRDNLYNIINKRVDEMFKNNLISEVGEYHKKNIRTKPLINGIGYRELYQYFDGEITLDEAKELIKKHSRNYAKRQYTFFNNQLPVTWFDTNYDDFNITFNRIVNYIDKNI